MNPERRNVSKQTLRTGWFAFAMGLILTAALPAQQADSLVPAGAGETRAMVLRVRDAMTGLGVPGVAAQAVDPNTRLVAVRAGAGSDGLVRIALPAQVPEVEIIAEGYRAMRVPPLPPEISEPVTTVWLTPKEKPEELRPEVLEARRLPNMTLLHGRVVDLESGQPMVGAEVRLARGGTATTTDETGYFLLYAKGTKVLDMRDVPEFDDLIVEAPGFVTVRLAWLALLEQDAHFIVDLVRGRGETVRDMSHKMFPQGVPLLEADPAAFFGGQHDDGEDPAALGTVEGGTVEGGETDTLGWDPMTALAHSLGGDPRIATRASWSGLQVLNPPDQIYVNGYGWYYLEVYLARGLCNEWISSWGAQALDAGSVAYRSYGSWYQINQGSICATTSCQVFTNTYVQACDLASQRTAGMVLQKSGVVARSEYSAENNSLKCSSYSCVNTDLSCGSGKAGSPSASWPCLSDNHLFDQGPGSCCFGHGRGMCQWGTQAWSRSGKVWSWMVDQYYNASGAGSGNRTMYLTTPLEITTASASTTSVNRGGSFTINATVRNYADYTHSRIMLGASLIGPSTISDPARDKKISALARTGYTVQYRDTAVSRSFVVPSTATTGTYSLLVAIWYDSNNNSVIDSNDKPLRTITLPSAVTVH